VGGSGTSLERLAASAVAGGVSLGCAGGGCRRSAIGLREAQPEETTQRKVTTHNAQIKIGAVFEESGRSPNWRCKVRLRESKWVETLFDERLKARPAS